MAARSYSAQFDLMKDVRVRVYTLLSGPCTGGRMIKSTNYTELVRKPPNTGTSQTPPGKQWSEKFSRSFEKGMWVFVCPNRGAANTEVRDFVCVNYNMMNVECTWKKGAKTPDDAQQHLYFWYLVHLNHFHSYDSDTTKTLKASAKWRFDAWQVIRFVVHNSTETTMNAARGGKWEWKRIFEEISMLRFISVHHKKKNQNNSQMCVVFSRPRHKELEHVEECPLYIISRGIRSGCRFTGTSLPLFTDINLCVNGSSPEGPLRPHLISLQIQNHGTHARSLSGVWWEKGSVQSSSHPAIVFGIVFPVKPPTTEKVYVHAGPDRLEISWEPPVGRVPADCLEWEVERRLEAPDGKNTSVRASAHLCSLSRGCARWHLYLWWVEGIKQCKRWISFFWQAAVLSEESFKTPSTVKHKHMEIAATHILDTCCCNLPPFSSFYLYVKLLLCNFDGN